MTKYISYLFAFLAFSVSGVHALDADAEELAGKRLQAVSVTASTTEAAPVVKRAAKEPTKAQTATTTVTSASAPVNGDTVAHVEADEDAQEVEPSINTLVISPSFAETEEFNKDGWQLPHLASQIPNELLGPDTRSLTLGMPGAMNGLRMNETEWYNVIARATRLKDVTIYAGHDHFSSTHLETLVAGNPYLHSLKVSSDYVADTLWAKLKAATMFKSIEIMGTDLDQDSYTAKFKAAFGEETEKTLSFGKTPTLTRNMGGKNFKFLSMIDRGAFSAEDIAARAASNTAPDMKYLTGKKKHVSYASSHLPALPQEAVQAYLKGTLHAEHSDDAQFGEEAGLVIAGKDAGWTGWAFGTKLEAVK